MRKTIIGTIALSIVAVVVIGLFTMNQPKVELGMGADLEVVEVDTSWEKLVAKTIDTGEGTTDVVKEVVDATTTDSGTTEAYSKVEFTYKGETITTNTDFVGYNNCLDGMWGTSTVAFCTEFHKNQINKNAQWAREGRDGRDKQEALGIEVLTTKDL